jgi:hypothetical protein
VCSLSYSYLAPESFGIRSSPKWVLHIASRNIPPALLVTSLATFIVQSFDLGDPAQARLIAFKGQQILKAHSILLTIPSDEDVCTTSLIWLPWNTPDEDCSTIMSKLLPDCLPGFDPCSCGEGEWMWEGWGKIGGRPNGFRRYISSRIVCKACRHKAILTLHSATSLVPSIFLYPEDAPASQRPNWVQDHFEIRVPFGSVSPIRSMSPNITWNRQKRQRQPDTQ